MLGGCDGGGMRIDWCRPQSEELGEGDESHQCRRYRTGELRRWGSDRSYDVIAVRRMLRVNSERRTA